MLGFSPLKPTHESLPRKASKRFFYILLTSKSPREPVVLCVSKAASCFEISSPNLLPHTDAQCQSGNVAICNPLLGIVLQGGKLWGCKVGGGNE